MGVDFSGVSGDMEERAAAAVRQILAMDASPEYKKKRLLELLRRTGNAYHDQLFEASSEVFDSTAIQAARHDAKEQAERLATKLMRNNALNRETIDRLMGSYYNSLQGSAQEEAFRNAQSMQKHPTLTRSVNGVGDCKWCVSKSGTYTNPKGDDFRRHAKCDCKFEVSGYRSRNGELRNYSKKGSKSKGKNNASTDVAPQLKSDAYAKHFPGYDKSWKLEKGYPLTSKELNTVAIVRSEFKLKEVNAVRRVESPKGVKTPDLIIDGRKFEVKQVSSPTAVDARTRTAIKQVSTDGGIIYNATDWKDKNTDPVSYIRWRAENKNVGHYVVVKDGEVVGHKGMEQKRNTRPKS